MYVGLTLAFSFFENNCHLFLKVSMSLVKKYYYAKCYKRALIVVFYEGIEEQTIAKKKH